MTAETWPDLGKAFIAARGHGFLIALADGVIDKKTPLTATPREWGAWWAYFTRKGCGPVGWMKNRARSTTYDGNNKAFLTVPARWPHEFDAEATLAEDMEAANGFEARFMPERLDMAEAAQRQITSAWAKKAVRRDAPKPVSEPEQVEMRDPRLDPPEASDASPHLRKLLGVM